VTCLIFFGAMMFVNLVCIIFCFGWFDRIDFFSSTATSSSSSSQKKIE